MTPEEKVNERRIRRVLARRGLKLQRSARRDRGAIDYGLYRVLEGNRTVTGWMPLEKIEEGMNLSRRACKGWEDSL